MSGQSMICVELRFATSFPPSRLADSRVTLRNIVWFLTELEASTP